MHGCDQHEGMKASIHMRGESRGQKCRAGRGAAGILRWPAFLYTDMISTSRNEFVVATSVAGLAERLTWSGYCVFVIHGG